MIQTRIQTAVGPFTQLITRLAETNCPEEQAVIKEKFRTMSKRPDALSSRIGFLSLTTGILIGSSQG